MISHLALCAPCQDDLGDLHHARSVVRSLPTIEAPQWVLGGQSEVAPEHGRRPIVWAAAVAAAVLVVTIGIATWLTPVPELEMSYDEIANTHRVRASQDGTPTGAPACSDRPVLAGGSGMKRSMIIAVLAVPMVTASALPAIAQDLEEWLKRAAGAEYSGRQFTLCDTPDGRQVEIVEVVQRDGLLEVRAGSGSAVVGPNGIYQRSPDGTMSVTATEPHTGWKLADHYRVEFGDTSEVLRRPVDVLRVMDGDVARMELSFDRETGAVIEAQVFNADSTRYCTSSFIVFRTERSPDRSAGNDRAVHRVGGRR